MIHPLIRTHPADGRKALWVSTGTVKEVIGLPEPDGLALVDDLVAWATQDRFVYRHNGASATCSCGITAAPCTLAPSTTTPNMTA